MFNKLPTFAAPSRKAGIKKNERRYFQRYDHDQY